MNTFKCHDGSKGVLEAITKKKCANMCSDATKECGIKNQFFEQTCIVELK